MPVFETTSDRRLPEEKILAVKSRVRSSIAKVRERIESLALVRLRAIEAKQL